MIKRYLLDVLCIILIIIIPLIAAQRPEVDLTMRSSTGDKGQFSDSKKKENEKVQKEIMKEVVALKSLKERNIFAPDGTYSISETALKGPLPKHPYTLIGILQGEEKKAVFRDYTGSIITLVRGKKLIDGSVIKRIDRLSVELEKGKEKRELRIFDLTNPNRRAPPKPEVTTGPETPPRPERGFPQGPGRTPRQRPRP
jgi:hypothetical protein